MYEVLDSNEKEGGGNWQTIDGLIALFIFGLLQYIRAFLSEYWSSYTGVVATKGIEDIANSSFLEWQFGLILK